MEHLTMRIVRGFIVFFALATWVYLLAYCYAWICAPTHFLNHFSISEYFKTVLGIATSWCGIFLVKTRVKISHEKALKKKHP